MIEDGWYLMSTANLTEMLDSFRAGAERLPPDALVLGVEEALAYRNAGNLPDERDRSLRLVLRIDAPDDLTTLDARRRAFEPDYLEPPTWRVEGSRSVNVVPLRSSDVVGREGAWWEDEEVAALEAEWSDGGRVDDVAIPDQYRGFVFKSILALRAAGRSVSAESIADAIERWVPREVAIEIRDALGAANRPG